MDQSAHLRQFDVPLFPLCGVVLLPRAILPLHIFEERYKLMAADAVVGPKRIAMALLRPGWEKDYYSRPAIHPVVCVGQILSHEKLPDGNYNFLLQGIARARILDERIVNMYRLATVARLPELPCMEIDLAGERQRLIYMFNDGPLSDLPIVRQFRQMLASPVSTSDIADLIAFNLFDDVAEKQSLLENADARLRVPRVIQQLETLRPRLEAQGRRMATRPGLN